MAQLKDDEWPADNEPTTAEVQQRARGCNCDDVPPNPGATARRVPADAAADADEPRLANTGPDEATD